MNINYEFIGYVGSVFTNEKGDVVNYNDIKDKFFKLDGRIGKLIHLGYTNVYEQGYSGGYDEYGFVFQDDLSHIVFGSGRKFLLEDI